MALTATIDTSKTPFELTVVSDKRKFAGEVTVSVGGDTGKAPYSGAFEPTVTDSSGRVWTKKTDDGTTAVYTG